MKLGGLVEVRCKDCYMLDLSAPSRGFLGCFYYVQSTDPAFKENAMGRAEDLAQTHRGDHTARVEVIEHGQPS